MWDPLAGFKSVVLPNGLMVHVSYWPDRDWVATKTLIHSGARSDPAEVEGTAHFVEHLCSRNTILPYRDIKTFFQKCGGSVSLGLTSFNYTHYTFFSPTQLFGESLNLFGSMLLQAELHNFIDEQREVILGEYQRKFPMPYQADLLRHELGMVFGDHWRTRSLTPLGSLESIGHITQSDLQGFYDSHYTPANMQFVSVGGLSLDAVCESLLNSPYGMNKTGERTPLLIPLSDFATPGENRHLLTLSEHVIALKPKESAEYESVAIVPGSIDRRALNIVKSMLSQILFDEVREKRAWTYSTGCNRYNFQDVWEFSVRVNAFSLGALPDIENVVEDCIASLVNHEDLFYEKVSEVVNSFAMQDRTAVSVCNEATDDLTNHDRILTHIDEGKAYSALTMKSLDSVLPWLQARRRWTNLIVP